MPPTIDPSDKDMTIKVEREGACAGEALYNSSVGRIAVLIPK